MRLPDESVRLRRLARLPLVSAPRWLRRIVFWAGAVVPISFASLANLTSKLFEQFQSPRPWVIFIVCPAGLVASFLLNRHVFPGAQGSGIPQVIAAQHMTDRAAIAQVLSVRIAAGKVALTLLGLASGASIGREGPTVQVGAVVLCSIVVGLYGGLFAPSLSVGGGLGAWLAQLMPSAPAGAVVLLGMVGYFSGVVQAPITATIIVMEMTDDQRITVPLLATAPLAFGVSRLVCRRPFYSALAHRFIEAQQRAAC